MASTLRLQYVRLSFISYIFPPQILNEPVLKYEPPVNKSLPAAPKGIDESKVIQALEDLLEGPLKNTSVFHRFF